MAHKLNALLYIIERNDFIDYKIERMDDLQHCKRGIN